MKTLNKTLARKTKGGIRWGEGYCSTTPGPEPKLTPTPTTIPTPTPTSTSS